MDRLGNVGARKETPRRKHRPVFIFVSIVWCIWAILHGIETRGSSLKAFTGWYCLIQHLCCRLGKVNFHFLGFRQAILVSPTSGHPYNQLALLEASQGNKLSTVYHYVRSIAVKSPFPAATTNLMNTLLSAVDREGLVLNNFTIKIEFCL